VGVSDKNAELRHSSERETEEVGRSWVTSLGKGEEGNWSSSDKKKGNDFTKLGWSESAIQRGRLNSWNRGGRGELSPGREGTGENVAK